MKPLSVFVMYSPDRRDQLDQMIRINSRMKGWQEAEKILLVDGVPPIELEGFQIVEVPRQGDFCWASMWEAGVQAATHDHLWYLDSDRVLPVNYLEKAISHVDDNTFVFSDSLFNVLRPALDEEVTTLIDFYNPERMRTKFDELNQQEVWLAYDPRYRLPLRGPGKGPMSGNVMFTRTGYERSGGVDPFFRGHGAWADSDYHFQVWELGYQIVALEETEVHLWHKKYCEDREVDLREIEILSLNNFVYHAKKWNLGYHYPKAIAAYLKLEPDFVDRVLDRLESDDFKPLLD